MKDVFNSNLTTLGENFGVTFKVYYGFIGTDKPCPLKICNGHRTPEKIFHLSGCRSSNDIEPRKKLIVENERRNLSQRRTA